MFLLKIVLCQATSEAGRVQTLVQAEFSHLLNCGCMMQSIAAGTVPVIQRETLSVVDTQSFKDFSAIQL